MPTLHASLLAQLKLHSGNGTSHTGNASYLGNTHASYHISNPIKHKIAKEFLKAHPDLSFKEFVALLTALFAAPSYDEKAMAAMLIGEAAVLLLRGIVWRLNVRICGLCRGILRSAEFDSAEQSVRGGYLTLYIIQGV
jgi:hypothetical protein